MTIKNIVNDLNQQRADFIHIRSDLTNQTIKSVGYIVGFIAGYGTAVFLNFKHLKK